MVYGVLGLVMGVVVAAFAVSRTMPRLTPRAGLLRLLALLVGFVLFYPSISLADDLQQQPQMPESPGSTLLLQKATAAGADASAAAVPVVAAALLSPDRTVSRPPNVPRRVRARAAIALAAPSLRAPPAR